MANNADLGITIQKLICDHYSAAIHPKAHAQFEANFNPKYIPAACKAILKIFNEIHLFPKVCLTYAPSEKAGETLSPHNFILEDGSFLSIRTNKKGDKVAPRVVGQCGIATFNAHFSEISGKVVEDKEEIKAIIFEHIAQMIPIFLDYMFVSDYTAWVQDNGTGEYDCIVFDRSKIVDIIPDRELFTFTKNIECWNESTTLKYKGISLAEIQIHKNRTFKFRFIMNALMGFITEQKNTTETFGMTAEKTICDLFRLKYDDNLRTRSSPIIQQQITSTIEDAFKHLPKAIKHTGSQKGERGAESKCPYDFLLDGQKKLSLKTNTGKMICPPEVGQPSASTCYLYFGHLTDAEEITPTVFKEMVFNQIGKMVPIYLSHLLDSDYLLWVFKRKNGYGYKIFDSDYAKYMVWDTSEFTFTKSTVSEWNESNTLKYKGVSIGEFQVHKARSCYKFRFNMENLEKIIKGGV